jgi:hypothetical protein
MDYQEKGNVSKKVLDFNRARQSLIEELQAIMWYDERADATSDKALKETLVHNRDDEKEHASLLIEWLRRNDPNFNKKLKEILFKNKEMSELWD